MSHSGKNKAKGTGNRLVVAKGWVWDKELIAKCMRKLPEKVENFWGLYIYIYPFFKGLGTDLKKKHFFTHTNTLPCEAQVVIGVGSSLIPKYRRLEDESEMYGSEC